MEIKEYAAFIAILISLIANTQYVVSVIQRKTKPHMFSWLIWSLVTIIAAAAQYSGKAGIGAIATGVEGLCNVVIASFAIYFGDIKATKSERISFLLALFSIPLWYLTDSALSAVILLTFIELAGGYYPTLHKSFYRPRDESILIFSIFLLGSLLRVVAIEHYSFTTTLYAATVVFANLAVIIVLFTRRKAAMR